MIKRLDHTGIVVEDLAAAVAFFVEPRMELEGETTVGGEWVDQLVGLEGVEADMAMLRTPDGACEGRRGNVRRARPARGEAPQTNQLISSGSS